MKIILCIWVLFSLVTGCSADSNILKNNESSDRITTVLEHRNNIAYLPNESQSFSGKYVTFHSNKQKKSEVNYIDGKLNGISILWHKNGQKETLGKYKEGKLNGLLTGWYDNGQKEIEINFLDGKFNGLTTKWYKNGKKKGEEHYKDDVLKSETNFKDGTANILAIGWDENGQIDSQILTVWDENEQQFVKNRCIYDSCKVMFSDDENEITNGVKKALIEENETEQKTSEPKQKIISRCRTQMGEHGAAMVKACVDQELEAYQALADNLYLEKHKDILTRCLGQMGKHGYAMVKACADQDIEAEDALGKY
jgi:antitoxin component YwqK of YwqJK toxin-antitoxin module